MLSHLVLWSLQLVAVNAAPNFAHVLEFHQKRQTPDQALSACSVVLSKLTSCGAIVPGFNTLPASSQAPCACYYIDPSTTVWQPYLFDNAVATCGAYARTVSPAVYSGLQPFTSLCNRVGDLRTVRVTTTTPVVVANPPPAACNLAASALQFCSSAYPGNQPIQTSAYCLCYSSTSWIPSVFDGAIRTCASYAKTAAPADYAVLTRYDNYCTNAGEVLKSANNPAPVTPQVIPDPTPVFTPATTPPTTPQITPAPSPSVTGLATFPACSAIGQSVISCERASPGFTTMAPSVQAACLCYTSSTSWIPNSFDSPASTCADLVKTADPSDYSVFSNLAGFCSHVGDIYAAQTPRTSISVAPGGIGAGGLVFSGDSTSATPTRTITVQAPGAATPTSSRALAVPSAVVGSWVKVISFVVMVQVLA